MRGRLSSFRTAAAAARFAQRLLADNGQLRQVWRFVLIQLLDDYASVVRHDGVAAASGMWTLEPPQTGSSQVDAALAAMAEYLARRDGWLEPGRVRDPRREATP
jgi:class 3 adenylate cyclase